MGAHWHIILPIKFQVDEKLCNQFEENFGKEYFEVDRVTRKKYSPELSDGSRLEFINTYVTYQIQNLENVLTVFKDFFTDFYNFFREEYKKDEVHMQNAFLTDELNSFLKELKSINFSDLESLKYTLPNCEDNYFLLYNSTPSMVVYEGYPLKQDNHSSTEGFIIMYSYFKMQESYETYHIFKTAVKKFTELNESKYPFTKSLIVMGY